MLVFIAFWILLFLTIARPGNRTSFQHKSWQDWLLDGTGLLFQGLAIPILQVTLVYQLYSVLIPHLRDILVLPPMIAFLLSFVFVDYLYYWNHRLLHSRFFWRLHQVHHTVTQRDVLGTSRNTLWTSFFILYLLVHALFIYLLFDPKWYVLGISLTSILDLWRHSAIEPKQGSFFDRAISPWLTLPRDHAWHHTPNPQTGNYGANFKLWDKLHRTNCTHDTAPTHLGIDTQLTLIQKLFFPIK
ncbi:sterol desaturase family protein [Lusitaniella coriacea LEGE 07157]|uniref:Sterol desaturase family protein n=1 Tax=Lusitaniella coriacea LEGE 07157 TaxID=945747 RepID=A0A8J7IX33_9CYAN|nr:sterol desaturase family protein [Lusitaniella coriacea]MBE9118472.1 sterol desaturase family protein [Lusitaniella coriacea LEGE 07157]